MFSRAMVTCEKDIRHEMHEYKDKGKHAEAMRLYPAEGH